MRHRYDLLRISTDAWGNVLYEVADLKTGVIFWTRRFPPEDS